MSVQSNIDKMLKGDTHKILDGLQSRNFLERANAIACTVKYDLRTKQTGPLLRSLKSDDRYLGFGQAGPRVCDFACAALHLLDIEPYQGTEKYVWDLIDIKLNIYQ